MTEPLKELPRALCWKIAPQVNSGKLLALEHLDAEWRRVLPLAFHWFWDPFLRGGLMPRNPARSGPHSTFPNTKLVTSQKDLLAVAIEGQAKGWASNLKNRIAKAFMRDTVLATEPELRRELLWINAMRAWLLPYPEQLKLFAAQPSKATALKALSPYASRVMRLLVRRYMENHRIPDPMQLPLQVNQLSSVFRKATDTQSFWAHSWLRISTLERGSKIELPVMNNAYAHERAGRRASTYALFKKEGQWFVRGTQYVAPTPWEHNHVEVLGIDLGLRNLMSSSEGDILGAGFLEQLSRYDRQLQTVTKGLQQAGQLRLNQCRRYRVLVARLRGWLKTTMQTQLRILLERRKPQKVVIEDLLFAGEPGTLSRRMNRLLRRFGQRYFTQTLQQHQAQFGFELEIVNPAYTSQICARCGFVHRDNRREDKFECKACGHLAHADVNGAKNLVRRSSLGAISATGGLHGQWVLSLQGWLARQRAMLSERGTSGPLACHRAVGSARVGLKVLASRGSSAQRLSAAARKRMLQAAKAPTLEGLLKGLTCDSSDFLKSHSTQ